MNILANLSNIIIPLLIFYIVAYGISAHVNVYDEFLEGAKSGMQTVISIAPTMIGLMIAVGVLRASGFLDFVGAGCFPVQIFLLRSCPFCSSKCFPLLPQPVLSLISSRNMDRTAGPDF
mgnify:CR=1 FL=1